MRPRTKKALIILGAVILFVAIFVGWAVLRSRNIAVPDQAATVQNTTGLVQVCGRSLYDPEGRSLQLRGINAGQLLLQEGWMSPFALEPLKNADGSFVTDKNGNLQYPEFSEEQFRAGLAANENLKGYDPGELREYYYDCFFSEADFDAVKAMGFNTLRLPFYWQNILNEDLTVKEETEAFAFLDRFIAQAAERELYIILDLHGAPGSQNGYEHSGVEKREALLWKTPEYMDATVALWDAVSRHYSETRPDLGAWIATYDLLNEPTDRYKGTTGKTVWDFFDRVYDAIRANGDAHVITMAGCWDYASLPDPGKYGWENVQYEYHWYNWMNSWLPYDLFYAYQDLSNIGRDYEVPVLIGEFTFFEDKEAWQNGLELFDRRGYSWTIWNYKTTVTGWWTSSWGLYTCQLDLTDAPKCNVSTCTYEEFIAACEATRTENCATGTLYEVLRDYFE